MSLRSSSEFGSNGRSWPHWLLWPCTILGIAWPMIHSVALRNALLAILLIGGIKLYRRQQIRQLLSASLQTPARLYILLSAWLLATVTLADNLLNSLSQYRGEWLMAFFALTVGLLLARLAEAGKLKGLSRNALLGSINLALAIPCLIQIGHSLLFFSQHQTLPLWDVPLFGRTSLSYVHNLLYGMLLADALARSSGKTPLLPLSRSGLLLAFALSFFCTYLLNTRNGTLDVLLITLFAALIAWYQHRQQINNALLAVLMLALLLAMGGYAKLSYDAEPRWAAFGESTRLALDTQHSKAWLDDRIPLPLMSNGHPVDHSAYMRLAWFKEGVQAILDNPLGVGFGRNAFGHAMQRKYGEGRGHSHSSLIDFTLSGGIPGLLLWFIFSASLLRLGWRAYFSGNDVVGMALVMLIVGTLLRMVVDSNLRDHGLEQYLFLLAALATLAAARLDSPTTMPPTSLQSDDND